MVTYSADTFLESPSRENAALEAAMRVFWRQGYAGASYQDLARATGIGRKGLYTAFGDKRSLFIHALRHYRTSIAVDVLGDLDADGAGVADIVTLFERIAASVSSEEGRIGCLMANTAADVWASDTEVTVQIAAHLERTCERFERVLDASGLAVERSVPLADYLTGLLQAVFLLGHAGAPASMINNLVGEGMRGLREASSPAS